MDINAAKELVIEAGKKLVEEGLIQRTWGNVSCRIDGTCFAITPSGMDYLSLTPDKIVVVNIEDLSYEGDIKPSSEKGIHAACYKLRPDCNFVIHTHQLAASLYGLPGFDCISSTAPFGSILGDNVPLASYGLPGTGKLRNGVIEAVKRSNSKAVLMHHHGALCMGSDSDEAFRVAQTLEIVCNYALLSAMGDRMHKCCETVSDFCGFMALKAKALKARELDEAVSFRTEDGLFEITRLDNGEKFTIRISDFDGAAFIPDVAKLHAEIYSKRKDVNVIIPSKDEATLASSVIGKTVRPYLDDFAQIVGINLKCASYNPQKKSSAKKAAAKLGKRDALLLRNNGALCVGKNEDEAEAVKLVAEKGCKAYMTSYAYDGYCKPINPAECALMRVVYKLKYSKQK